MVEIVFAEIVLGEIRYIGLLDVGNVGKAERSDIHDRLPFRRNLMECR